MRLGPRTGIYAEDAGKKKQEKNREMMINFLFETYTFLQAQPWDSCVSLRAVPGWVNLSRRGSLGFVS